MQAKNFSIKKALKYGFTKAWENLGLMVSLCFFIWGTELILRLVAYVYIFHALPTNTIQFLQIILSPGISEGLETSIRELSSIFFSIGLFCNVFFSIGLIGVGLAIYNTGKPTFSSFFRNWPLLLASCIALILPSNAQYLFIVLFLIFFRQGYFIPMIITEGHYSLNDAMKISFQLAKGLTIKLFMFLCIVILLDVVSLIGMEPPLILAEVYVYKTLLQQQRVLDHQTSVELVAS